MPLPHRDPKPVITFSEMSARVFAAYLDLVEEFRRSFPSETPEEIERRLVTERKVLWLRAQDIVCEDFDAEPTLFINGVRVHP